MKINRLETHDRLLEFNKQSNLISAGCQECINSRPEEFKNYPIYLFAHKREIAMDERIGLWMQDIQDTLLNPMLPRRYTSFEQVPTARLVWQSRLTKPSAQQNSMCFRVVPPSDNIRIIWILPDIRVWDQYKRGNMVEMDSISQSIHDFEHNKEKLDAPEDDDLPLEKVKQILIRIAKKPKPKTSGAFLV